uniref:C2H2-type domain-containing protein n=1 Tax=Clytia hemisphaerica TaxID=252671 RepID=A0A7M5X3J2_9CNID
MDENRCSVIQGYTTADFNTNSKSSCKENSAPIEQTHQQQLHHMANGFVPSFAIHQAQILPPPFPPNLSYPPKLYKEIGQSPLSIKNRGRPSADVIELLKQRSIQSPHRYSCSVCHRSFPRKKSLDTHRLTHSDVKPYACDFPGCTRKFKQSGQLKTHLRLHTGEKPFQCTFPDCESTFTHANRKCTMHPDHPLRRISTESISEELLKNITSEETNENIDKIKVWFEKHFSNKDNTNDNKENIPPNSIQPIIKAEPMNNEILECENYTEENNKRLLSAVALVELRDQMKNPSNKKDNFSQLFTSHEF